MEPGQTVSPGGASEPTWQFHQDSPSNPAPSDPGSSNQAGLPEPQAPQSDPAPAATQTSSGVTWTASEFIAHAKSSGWYAILGIATLAVAAAVYLLTKDIISTLAVIIVAIIFGMAAARKPRELQYQVDNKGIQIDTKNYPYQSFKSFSVVKEGGVESIWLMPLKRFMPILSIYFDPKDGDKIFDILSQMLPVENHEPDVVDRLMHKIHF